MGTSGGPVTKCGQKQTVQGTIWRPTDKVVPKTALFRKQLVVANCQSAAKNFTFTQSVCIADHLVAHCQNGAKDYVKSNAKKCTFLNSAFTVDHLLPYNTCDAK